MMDSWDWLWGALMMLVFWGGLAAVIVFAVRASSGRGPRPGSGETTDARTILEGRFAKGEISQEEFEQRKRVLGSPVR
jgi:putative membrane protein